MLRTFGTSIVRRLTALLLAGCLVCLTASQAAIVDEFNDGTLSANWITNNYPQYNGTPNDSITFTEYTSLQFDAVHAPGYLQVNYDDINSNPQTTFLMRSDIRLDSIEEFVQVDLRINSGAISANICPGLALATTDNGINQDRSSCAYVSLRNDGVIKINAYGANGTEIYDQAVTIPDYAPGNNITLRIMRTASGVFQVWWGDNLVANNLAGTINFGSATHPTVPGLMLGNGLNDYEAAFDRFVTGIIGGTGDVTGFGPVPNDSISDSSMLKGVLADFAHVTFPAGTYDLSETMYVDGARTIEGPSTGSPAILHITHDDGSLTESNHAIEITGHGATIAHLTIDKDFIDGSYAVGINAVGPDNLTIEDVEIRDYSVRYGIHLNGCDNFLITGCFIHSFMMNQNNPSGYEADMIEDSPAGIRISSCNTGEISYCSVFDIEVGAAGRVSTSELRPSYGLQGYQADCLTIFDSTNIIIENNNLWNSGELVDLLVSNNCIMQNNLAQMAWYVAAKCIGSYSCLIQGNTLGDAAVGCLLLDHSTGGQCTDNTVDSNLLVNCGSRGVWDILGSDRLTEGGTGICIYNDANGNTITNNDIYNYFGYLTSGIEEGTGSNTISNNDLITTQYGPAGGPNVALLGSWTSGLTHQHEDYGVNRLLVFMTYAREEGANIDCTAVSYGGKAMTQSTERLVTEGTRRVYISTWVLKQDKINNAQGDTFSVTWNTTPDSVGYSSAFYENVNQTSPIYTSNTGAATSGSVISCTSRATHNGDLVFYGAVAGPNNASFTPNNGFTEDIEVTISNADGCAGHKAATGANEAASVNHSNMGTGAIAMGCLTKN